MIMPMRLCDCGSVGAMRTALRAWISASASAPLPNSARASAWVAGRLFGIEPHDPLEQRLRRRCSALRGAKLVQHGTSPPMCFGERSRSSTSSRSASACGPSPARRGRVRFRRRAPVGPWRHPVESTAAGERNPLPQGQCDSGSTGSGGVMINSHARPADAARGLYPVWAAKARGAQLIPSVT